MRGPVVRCLIAVASLVVALAAPAAARAGPDPYRPEFDRAAAAFKSKEWEAARALSAAFLKAHPGHPAEPTVLFFFAEAAFRLARFEESVGAAERYLAAFPAKPNAEPLEFHRAQALFLLTRGAEAKAAFGRIVATRAGKRATDARAWLARIDPPDVTVRGNVVLDYAGKYVGDPRFAEGVAAVERAVPEAARSVRERLSLPEGATLAFRVRFLDTADCTHSAMLETVDEIHGAVIEPGIVVQTEKLVAKTYDLPLTLGHELVHAWQHAGLGAAHARVPKWASEGLAVWASGQGPWHLTMQYNRMPFDAAATRDPAARFVNGLGGAHGFEDYTEDYLAFAWVESAKGMDVARRLAHRLLETPDAEGAFAEAAGMSFPDASTRARAFSENLIRTDLADREPYLAARRLLVAGRAAEAVGAFDALLAAKPEQVLAPRIRFERACALFRAGRHKESAEAFDALERLPFAEAFRDGVAEYRVRLAAARHDAAALDAAAKTFLRDFSWKDAKRLDAVRALAAKGEPPPDMPPDSPEQAEEPQPDDD